MPTSVSDPKQKSNDQNLCCCCRNSKRDEVWSGCLFCELRQQQKQQQKVWVIFGGFEVTDWCNETNPSCEIWLTFPNAPSPITLSRTSWCLGNSQGWSTGSSYSVIVVIVSCEANLYLRLLLALLIEVRTFSIRTIGAIK